MPAEQFNVSFQNARKFLALHEENWKREHDAAMEYWRFQEFLAETVHMYEIVRDVARLARKSIYRGIIPPLPHELAAGEREAFEQWLGMADWCSPQLTRLESEYGTVEGADVYRACVDEAKAFVADWRPQQPAAAGGSRVRVVSASEAARMRSVVDAAAPLAVKPESIPVGDPAELK